MEFWLTFLPVVIYVLLICLLIVGIIIGIKAIITINKVDKVVDNVSNKMDSLNGAFNLLDFTTDRLAGLTDHIVDGLIGVFGKILKNKRRKKEERKYE